MLKSFGVYNIFHIMKCIKNQLFTALEIIIGKIVTISFTGQRYEQSQTHKLRFLLHNISGSASYIFCWFISSTCAAVIDFIPSCTDCRLPFHEWSKSRSCCHCALPNVLCIVLELYTFRAAWSIRALTNLVFSTKTCLNCGILSVALLIER